MFLDGQLVRAELMPVIPGEFRIDHDRENSKMGLYHGFEKVESGVTWYGTNVKIDGKTGKLLHIPPKKAHVRAVFGGMHLEFVF